MNKLKVAIISNNDTLWSLYAWNNVFSTALFKETFACAGLWTCDQKFSSNKKLSVWKWYLKTFGSGNFFKLFCFVGAFKFSTLLKYFAGKYHRSFSKLALANHVPHFETATPNSKQFVNWVKENKIDILVIMVDHILKKDILEAPQVCVVNKHGSLLPANKGLFPYFWAKIFNQPQGISFHKVNEAIDEGDLYYQEKVTDPSLTKSMIAFYFYGHKNYYKMLDIALNNIANNITISPATNLPETYYSLPQPKEYTAFKNKGGKIISWSEIFLPFNL